MPVAIRTRCPPGSTTGPLRERIAESLAEQLEGTMIVWRFGAERVEDVLDAAAAKGDVDDVPDVGRLVAVVSARRREQVAA